jgi:non-ribosomal peptide synthetase component F
VIGSREPIKIEDDGSGVYAEKHLSLPPAPLLDFAKRNRLTPYSLLQGVWTVLLSHHSGQMDVVFGATVSGRPPDLLGVDSIVGLFINTLPVRVKAPQSESLLTWLNLLQADMAEARQYEYSPLVRVQSWSEVPRGEALFETTFVFENYPVDEALRQPGSLDIRSLASSDPLHYVLALRAEFRPELSLRFTYDRRRLAAEQVERMAAGFERLLDAIVSNSQWKIADLKELLERFDREQEAAAAKLFSLSARERLRGARRRVVVE